MVVGVLLGVQVWHRRGWELGVPALAFFVPLFTYFALRPQLPRLFGREGAQAEPRPPKLLDLAFCLVLGFFCIASLTAWPLTTVAVAAAIFAAFVFGPNLFSRR
jgi:hypothetical protein